MMRIVLDLLAASDTIRIRGYWAGGFGPCGAGVTLWDLELGGEG